LKVVFIGTVDSGGGAGIASYRLNKWLEKYHHTENYMIVGDKQSYDENVFCTRNNRLEYLIELAITKLTNKVGLQYQYFPFSTSRILKKVKELNPDIINLHNTHGGYFKTSLIQNLSKVAPIVWTLHDMWSVTGNAAHTFGDESWKSLQTKRDENYIYPQIGINTGHILLKQKQKIYSQSNLTIVSPSRWLYDITLCAPVFKNNQKKQIHHGVDIDVFKPKNKTYLRELFEIPYPCKVLFFIADSITDNPWKGGEILIEIIKRLDQILEEKVILLIVGNGNIKEFSELTNITVCMIGYVKSEIMLSMIYSVCDLFLYVTKAESFGLVLLEAIASGLPAITFNVGGCSDIIHDLHNGYVIPAFDVDLYVQRAMECLKNETILKTFSINARSLAKEKFSAEYSAHQYYELFHKVIR
jgi:glycosyltransferase involved in cell wall biosynthesis